MEHLTWDDVDRLTVEDAVRYFDDVDRQIKERKLERRCQNTRSNDD